MTNPSKQRGTRFETAVCRHMRARLEDDRIDRAPLSGAHDRGDIWGIRAHGFRGIAECKSHKRVTPALLAEWRGQTVDERENADADFALLVVREPNLPIGRSRVHVTVGDLCLVAPGISARYDGPADEAWVSMTLDECCDLIGGPNNE